MKTIAVVISLFLVFVASGCATTPKKLGLVQPLPKPENAIPLQQQQNNQFDEIKTSQKRTNNLLERLVITLENKKTMTVPIQTGKIKTVTAADFSKREQLVVVRKIPPKKVVKTANSEITRAEFNRLKQQVEELGKTAIVHGVQLREQGGKYKIFRISIFEKGCASLKRNKMEEQVDELTLLVDEMNLKYIGVVGFTNADGHKNNLRLSGERAKAVLDRITLHRPNNAENIEPKGGGESQEFGIAEENRCVIVVCEKKSP